MDFNLLKLNRAVFLWEVYEEPLVQIEKLDVVSGLNSVNFIEFTYRLELNNIFSVDDKVGPDVPDILTLIVHGYDALGLIVDSNLAEGNFESAVIYGFGIARAKGGPDILSDVFEKLVHYEFDASWV
jgi:hypothetical protein